MRVGGNLWDWLVGWLADWDEVLRVAMHVGGDW